MYRVILASLLLGLVPGGGTLADTRTEEHTYMLEAIRNSVARTAEYTGKSELSARVMEQMATVPRHEFVIPGQQSRAYLNTPLPIAHGQTISQPLIVALMTDFLEPKATDVMLEVGTGSGYQAAVLAVLVKDVYTIEIVAPLAEQARQRLERLGYANVHVRAGDGYLGWPEAAPFDSIVVTAGATHLPPPLLEQLKPGGRMVIPLGQPPYRLELRVVHRGKTPQDLRIERIMPVAFVPLTGGHEKPKQ